MTPQELQERTFEFAIAVYRLCRPLLRDSETRHVGQQLTRSGTSVAANYRAACHARSRAEFAAKLGVVREEADESRFWLDFLVRAGIASTDTLAPLRREANELKAIFASAYRTTLRRGRPGSKVEE